MFLAFLAVSAPFQRVLVLPMVSSVLELIIDYGSAFVTYGNETESKEVQFPGRGGPDKISGGGYSAVAPDTSLCTTGTLRLGCVLRKALDYSSLVTCSSGILAPIEVPFRLCRTGQYRSLKTRYVPMTYTKQMKTRFPHYQG